MREGITLRGSDSYFLNDRGEITGPVNIEEHNPIVHNVDEGSSVFRALSNPSIPNFGASNSAHLVENSSPDFLREMRVSSVSQSSDPVKKKRGRPRKYVTDGAYMSLTLSPTASSASLRGTTTSEDKPRRGRPPGTGWKQQLAPLGDWMNSSAGLAFTPHMLTIEVGEDISARILSFAQQRARALCILSANGSVSALTLRQPTTSGGIVTYEGHFQILCLSGSYLIAGSGGPRNRTGGISISVCNPDGHMIGGAVGGKLVAANFVQVLACSFIYNRSKAKAITNSVAEKSPADQSPENSVTPISAAPSQNLAPVNRGSVWSPVSRSNIMNIDLMHG